ncbi:MAG: BTAD domain-containing putative transcriptional regulator, partial [Candidatus Promineifilaceae bacterium]|nr:BTAD domain-containing putative transcriptional regulator [Candidatus Promineifilaceae bacterium]
MDSFKLSLLGSFQVTLDGEVVTAFRSDKVRALLAYLAVEANRPHRRDMLATLLWGKSDEESARASLRVSLSNLRKALRPLTKGETGDPPLHITRQTAQFNDQDPAVWVDVAAFTAHIKATETHPHQDLTHCLVCMRRLAQAVALYRGEFLAGLAMAGSPGFDEWRTVQQERYHQHVLAALDTLTAHHLASGDDEQAQAYARRQLTLTPWREEAHRQLMRALARRGQRAAALAQYQECRRTLADELGVTPTPETRALYEAIESGAIAEGAWQRTEEEPASSPPHNLPPQTTPFIGREEELRQLHRRLLDGAYPLVTLAGAGGVGKTRLALAAAEQIVRYFPDGVWFVPLAGVTETDTAESLPDAIASAIAAALDFTFTGQRAPTAQLLDYLREKTLLLLLDNFEHLLAAADFILEIVNTAPGVTLLVTTRERLNFQAEYVMRVEGLPVPASAEEEGAAQFSSVRLFVERAERTPAGFTLTGAELPHIIQVCRFVAGLPLGIELAASWIPDHTCAEIVQAMQESVDFL